jgi:exodeoxyribonuclease V gamma subunit
VAVRVHIASHPDALVALLCDQLAEPVGGLFDSEVVAVPSRGIERWLTQRIASGLAERGVTDGICANVDFPSPGRVVRQVLETVPELARSVRAWDGSGIVSHLLEVIDECLGEPWMQILARYLDVDRGGSPDNRLAAATKIGTLFSKYARRRPSMIRSWAVGDDVGPDGEPLSSEARWQAALWRELRRHVGVGSLPELMPEGLDPIRRGDIDPGLPERVAVYGLTSADPLDLEVLVALGAQCEVLLYVLHPSPVLWRSVEEMGIRVLPLRSADPTITRVANPLLHTWGRDVRELQIVLASHGLDGELAPSPPRLSTLLGSIQRDVQENRAPAYDPALASQVTGAEDRSLQIHVCHGARRQAEVVRDAILHLLTDDPTLEPRDIVVMTPDLATFAPLLEAAFPQRPTSGLPDLRLRIADRSPAVTNPLVAFTATLLDIAGSRLEADAVRDLVHRPVVQQRFGIDDDTAGAVVTMIDDARVAWGLDLEHRREWGVEREERTWRRGLDRTLTGVFYADDPVRTVGDLAPLDGVEGQETVPASVLASILDRLVAVRRLLCRRRPRSEWAGAIATAVRLLAAPEWGQEWQLHQLERLLAETFPLPESGVDPEISLGEARQAISVWTDERPSALHMRTGDVTVCTLVPMRSVPYRVVALVGMDESRFPRRGRIDGDDLLVDHEVVGDLHPGSMDRQLLLDALMAAGDHLLVTYSGRDDLTNAEIPPAVPVAELLDTVEEMVGEDGRKAIEFHHPLQSFSPTNFTPGELIPARPWGFDRMQYEGAVATQNRPLDASAGRCEWPEFPIPETIRLEDLVEFLRNPVQRFVKARLGFTVPDPGEIADDTLPVDLVGLERWGLTDRVLQGLIAGHSPDELFRRERGADALPPGRLGDDDLEKALAAAQTIHDAAVEKGYDPHRRHPFAGSVEVAGGVVVEGKVNADPHLGYITMVTPSRINGARRLRAFAEMVFLSALKPETAWTAVLIGKKEGSDKHVLLTIGPVKAADAANRRQEAELLLGDLVDLYVEGHRQPLPLPCETAYNWQRKIGTDEFAARRAADDAFRNEKKDRALGLVLPHIDSLDALHEAGFADFCERLWRPVLRLSGEKTL